MDNEKKLTLNYLKDMFNGSFDEDVIESVLEQRDWNTDRALDDLMNLAQGCTFNIPIEDFSDSTPSSQPVNSTPTRSNLVSDYIAQNGGCMVGDEKAESEDEIIVVDEEEFCLTGESESDDGKSTALKPLVIEQSSSPPKPSYANIARKNPPPVYQQMSQIQPPAILYQGYTSFARKKRTRDSVERVKLFVGERSKIMVILRGCSGSGKSSLAKEILKVCDLEMKNPYWYIHSADNYFHLNDLGTYQYDRNKLSDAHKWNQKNVLCVVHEGLTPVIMDNTHSELWEMEVWARLAVCAGYEIEVIEPDTPWAFQTSQLMKKTTHAVGKEAIIKMLKRYEYNVSSSVLLKSFHLEYAADKLPPQTGTCELTNQPLVSLFEDLFNAIHVFPKQLKKLRKQQRPSRKARKKQREMEEQQLDEIVQAIENCGSENEADDSTQDEIDLDNEVVKSFVKTNLNSGATTVTTTSDSDKSWEDLSEESCCSSDEDESDENSGDESDDAENDSNDSDNDSNSSHESVGTSENDVDESEVVADDGNDEGVETHDQSSDAKYGKVEATKSNINCANSIIDSFKNPALLEENEPTIEVNSNNKNKLYNRLYDMLSKTGPRLKCFENFHDSDVVDEVDNEAIANVSDPAIIQSVTKLIEEDTEPKSQPVADPVWKNTPELESETSTSIVKNILNNALKPLEKSTSLENALDQFSSIPDVSNLITACHLEPDDTTDSCLVNDASLDESNERFPSVSNLLDCNHTSAESNELLAPVSNLLDSNRTSAESFHDAQESLNSSFASPEVTVIYNEPDKLIDVKSNKSLKNINAAAAGNATSSSTEDDRNSLLNEARKLTGSVESDTSLSYRNNLNDGDDSIMENFTDQIISSSKFKPIVDEASASNVMIRNVIENDLWGDSFEDNANITSTDRFRGTSENSDENSDYGSNSSSSDELRLTDIHNSVNRFVNNDIKGDVVTVEKKKPNVNVISKNKNAAAEPEDAYESGLAWNIDSTVELNTLKERILVKSLDNVFGQKLPAAPAEDPSAEESDPRPANVSRKSSCGASFQLIENKLNDRSDKNLERDQDEGTASTSRDDPPIDTESKFWNQWMKGDSWDLKEPIETKDSAAKSSEAKPPRAKLTSADSPSKQKNTDISNSIRLVNDIKNADKNKILSQKLKSVNIEPIMNDYFKHRSYPNSEDSMFGLPAAYDVKFKNILHDGPKESTYYGINTMPKKINEENSDTDERTRPSCSWPLTDDSSDTESRRSPPKRNQASKNNPTETAPPKPIRKTPGKKPEEKTSPEFVDELVRRWKSIAMEETQPDYDKVLKWSPVNDAEDILDWNAEENKYSVKKSTCAKPQRASNQSNVNYFLPEEILSSKRDSGTNTATDDVSEGVKCLVARCREINVNRDLAEVSSIELKMKCDKSTMTEGSCYTVKVKPVREDLSNMFPKEMADSILDLYEKCSGNMDWIIEILMEDGYSPTDDQLEYLGSLQNVVSYDVAAESTVKEKEKPAGEKKKSKQNGNGSKSSRRNNNQEDRSPFESPKKTKKKKLDFREETKQMPTFDKEPYFMDESEAPFNVETPEEDTNEGSVELFLDANMIQQLIGYFGNPTIYNMNDCQPVINLPVSLARQIHASLLESVIDQAEKNEFLINQLAEDELITEDPQNLEPTEDPQNLEPTAEVTQNDMIEVENSLSDVINSHVAEPSNNENSFASKLSLDLLLKSFPTVDPSYVTSTFKLNNYNYYDTKKVLNQMTPEVATNLTFNLNENKGNLVDRIKSNNDVPLFEPAAASLARNDVLDQVNSYRDDATFNYEQWQKVNEQLKTALQRKRFGVAPYYRELMSAFKQKHDEANANAAAVLINSCCKNSNVIDLHFFKVTEALRALDIFLDHHIVRLISAGRSKTTLYIITGRGAGNSGGVSLLQPPIKSRLKKRSIYFEVQPYNTGLVIAVVRKNSPLTNDL